MLRLKKGVKIKGVQPELMLAAQIVDGIYSSYNNSECVITAARDGTHMTKSFHYVGYALDFRIRHIPEGWRDKLYRDICRALGDEFDVVLEKTHVHVEFDPTKPI
jgi:hypothetical protein